MVLGDYAYMICWCFGEGPDFGEHQTEYSHQPQIDIEYRYVHSSIFQGKSIQDIFGCAKRRPPGQLHDIECRKKKEKVAPC